MMKATGRFAMLGALLVAGAAQAAPMELGYQGRLLDSSGVPIEGTKTITFALYKDTDVGDPTQAPTAAPAWTEDQQLGLTSGFYATQLGADAQNPLPDSLFDGGPLWLLLTVDGEPLLPLQKVTSVAYAIQSETATNVRGGTVDASSISVNGTPVIDSSGQLDLGKAIPPCQPGQVLQWNGNQNAWGCGSVSGTITAGSGIAIDAGGTISLGACQDGEVWKRSGGSWTCQPDAGIVTESDPTVNALAKASLSCATNEVVKWNGSAWICSADTDTTYSAGSGISINGTTIASTLGTDIDSSEIVDGTITAADIDATQVQRRVSGTCAAGEAIVAVATDGTVTCARMTSTGGGLIPNAFFEKGLKGWTMNGFSGSVVSSSGAPGGTAVFQNTTGWVAWVSNDVRIPIDRERIYTVSGYFRYTGTGGSAGRIYLAVRLFDASGNNISGAGQWWYYPASYVDLSGDTNWHRFQQSFGRGMSHPFPADAKTMTVGFILNYDGAAAGNRVFQATGFTITMNDLGTPGKLYTALTPALGWFNYGNGYAPMGYYKDPNGIVHLRGLIKYPANTGWGGPWTIGSLPPGYRPAYRRSFITGTYNSSNGRLDIKPDGTLIVVHGQGTWFSLDGVSFPAAQ